MVSKNLPNGERDVEALRWLDKWIFWRLGDEENDDIDGKRH
jgi:hypothetical protein